MIPKSSFYVSHPPPIKKTPLVGVFFIGVDGRAAWNLCKPPYERNHEGVIEGGLPRAQRGCSKSLHLQKPPYLLLGRES
jgi:hypothetical protein